MSRSGPTRRGDFGTPQKIDREIQKNIEFLKKTATPPPSRGGRGQGVINSASEKTTEPEAVEAKNKKGKNKETKAKNKKKNLAVDADSNQLPPCEQDHTPPGVMPASPPEPQDARRDINENGETQGV
jgi:hypothetical protein